MSIMAYQITRNLTVCSTVCSAKNDTKQQHSTWLALCVGNLTVTGGFLLNRVSNAGSHDDVIKWNHFPRYWPFVWGIHRSLVNSPHKGQWRGALIFSLICTWINGWVNNRKAGNLRCHHAHYDVTVLCFHAIMKIERIIVLRKLLTLKTKGRQFYNFVVTGGTVSCQNDNLRCTNNNSAISNYKFVKLTTFCFQCDANSSWIRHIWAKQVIQHLNFK